MGMNALVEWQRTIPGVAVVLSFTFSVLVEGLFEAASVESSDRDDADGEDNTLGVPLLSVCTLDIC